MVSPVKALIPLSETALPKARVAVHIVHHTHLADAAKTVNIGPRGGLMLFLDFSSIVSKNYLATGSY